jgi:hypothetical protein
MCDIRNQRRANENSESLKKLCKLRHKIKVIEKKIICSLVKGGNNKSACKHNTKTDGKKFAYMGKGLFSPFFPQFR